MKNNIRQYRDGQLQPMDIAACPAEMATLLHAATSANPLHEYILLPGLVDVHVHLREPGFFYKEDMGSGTRAAAHGGYTTVCTMPNLQPVPDSLPHLQVQLDAIAAAACIEVRPYGAISIGEQGEQLSDMQSLAPYVVAFSDDGRGVQRDNLMRQAMCCARNLGKLIVAHCEDNRLLHGGYIHDGEYAALHGHLGISSASEWKQIARDLQLVRETGCGYHVCHISTAQSVELIRQAKAEGLNVSCETAPHYLLLTDMDLQDDGCFKMNPPLRSASDRDALLAGLQDGTIDMIATDHAPHSAEEKARGLRDSLMGIVGLETAFPLLYTYLVRKGILSLPQLLRLMTDQPRCRFGLPARENDYCLFDLSSTYCIEPQLFLSKGRSTPFGGWTVQGECLLTVAGGRIAWQKPSDR